MKMNLKDVLIMRLEYLNERTTECNDSLGGLCKCQDCIEVEDINRQLSEIELFDKKFKG